MGTSVEHLRNLPFVFGLFLLLLVNLPSSKALFTEGGNIADEFEDFVKTLEPLIGGKTLKEHLAELIKTSGSEKKQVLILRKSDIANDIPKDELPNTKSIVKKIGDVTLVVNTTIDATKDGNGIVMTFETEVKPPTYRKICYTDNNCTDNKFCHRKIFMGVDVSYCEACSKDGAKCQADSHCCGPSICRWGRCRTKATAASDIGKACRKMEDCGDSQCCALVEGFRKPVCRPLADEGQHCSIQAQDPPENTTSLSILDKLLRSAYNDKLTYECPCVTGLKCINYGQNLLVNLIDAIDRPSSSGVCVPEWANPDRLKDQQTVDEIKRLQAEQLSEVVGDGKD